MESDVRNVDPFAGVEIETVGGVLRTVTVEVTDVLAPSASVTRAVIVCVPLDSLRENVPPSPICPSRLDVHTIDAVRSPSVASPALP